MNEQRNLCFWHINLGYPMKFFVHCKYTYTHIIYIIYSTNRQRASEFISISHEDKFYLATIKPPEQTVKGVNGINTQLICLFLCFDSNLVRIRSSVSIHAIFEQNNWWIWITGVCFHFVWCLRLILTIMSRHFSWI